MVAYMLKPFGQGAEYLNSIEIDTENENLELVLGRNAFTGLSDSTRPNFQYVSRRHVLITVKNGALYIESVSTQPDAVYYNGFPCPQTGPREFREGDCLSLLGVKAYYNYFLSRVHTNTISRQPSVTSSSSALNTTLALSESQPSVNRTQSLGNSTSNNGTHPTTSPRDDLNKSDDVVIIASTIEPHVVPPADMVDVVDLLSSSSSDSSSSIANTAAATGSAAVADASAAPPAEAAIPAALPALAHSISSGDLLRQFECSICYETMACASIVQPCGDTFCLICIADWAAQNKAGASANAECSCPNCQRKFTMSNVFPNRLVDNLVRVALQNIPEELATWEERLQQGNERRRLINEAAVSVPTSSAPAPAAPVRAAPRVLTADQAAHAAHVEQMQSQRNRRMDLLTARLEQQERMQTAQGAYGGMPFPHNPTYAAVTGRSAAAPARRREPPQVIELLDSQPQYHDEPPEYWPLRTSAGRAYPAPPPVPVPTAASAAANAGPFGARRPAPKSSINSYFTAAPATAAPPPTAAATAAASVRTASPPRGGFGLSGNTGFGLQSRLRSPTQPAVAHVNPAAALSRTSIVPGSSLFGLNPRITDEDRSNLREVFGGGDGSSSDDELRSSRRSKKRKGPPEPASNTSNTDSNRGNGSSSSSNVVAPASNQYVPASVPTTAGTGANNSYFDLTSPTNRAGPASSSAAAAPRGVERSEFYAAMPTNNLLLGRFSTPCARCGVCFDNADLAVGIYTKTSTQPHSSARYAVMSNLASQNHWATLCTQWYHLECVAKMNAARAAAQEEGEPICYDKLALTYYLLAEDQRQLREHLS